MILIVAVSGVRSITLVSVERVIKLDSDSVFSTNRSSMILIGTMISLGPPGVNVYVMSCDTKSGSDPIAAECRRGEERNDILVRTGRNYSTHENSLVSKHGSKHIITKSY